MRFEPSPEQNMREKVMNGINAIDGAHSSLGKSKLFRPKL
jgi:hypothetical protein